MIFFDTETCGFHGPIVLVQYAIDDGDIQLYSPWTTTISETLELFEMFALHQKGVCGFHLAFDWFHICQMYTTLKTMVKYGIDPETILQDNMDEYIEFEPIARDGPCLKPITALDIMLHARKGPYQSTMDRSDIKVRKVPTPLAWKLAEELNVRVQLPDVFFGRYADPKRRWQVFDIDDEPDFKNVVLKFAPTSALKALAADALQVDVDSIKLFSEVELPKKAFPTEYGYAPFAQAAGEDGWPKYIEMHINHWLYNQAARQYAEDDVKYTRMLYHHFQKPPAGDMDSVLACMVGAIRWRGFKINIDAIEELRKAVNKELKKIEFNFLSPVVCRRYLEQVLDETEKSVLGGSTAAGILEEISHWEDAEVCDGCRGTGCDKCVDGFLKTGKPHPAAIRATEILNARHAKKELELYDKLLKAGRFHASFNIIGTLSGRMSGSDKLNPQGIKRTKEVRACFPLAPENMVLSGGDFEGFEVTLMDAEYGDPKLREDLLSGRKIHALFGECLFPGHSYDDIVATKSLPGEANLYDRSKRGVFGLAYGGNEHTLTTRIGISVEAAEEGYQRWINRYKVWGAERQKIFNKFCSMQQPGGIGTKVEWHDPAEYVETMFGFRRYFTIENMIVKTLFGLANKPPKDWLNIKLKVVRRDRIQTVSGAVQSALYAAAFNIQASNMRAAANHVIQSAGATITKMLQVTLWNFQPPGSHEWKIMLLNIHDEIMAPIKEELVEPVEKSVEKFVEVMKSNVPLLSIDWHSTIDTWANK